jgi:septation ring formation regulator EzrA
MGTLVLQMPGGPELLVIVLIFALLLLPVVLLVAGYRYLRRSREDRITELEERVDALEDELQ